MLPFANIGGDPEQDYFVDGVTESLTTDLSRMSGMLVIGRNTAFTYKDKAVNLKTIGRELNVRYVLEGSVQRGGNRMRVNVQLIDAESGTHLWADRFEKPVADLFDMQDEIVARLANALNAQLVAAEARRAEKTPHPDSIDLLFQGVACANRGTTLEVLQQARGYFERALTLDPDNQGLQSPTSSRPSPNGSKARSVPSSNRALRLSVETGLLSSRGGPIVAHPSCRRGRARLQRRMPAVEVSEVGRDREARGSGKVERDEPGDVGDGETLARNERPLTQDIVENHHVAQRPGAVGGGPIRDLGTLELRHMRVGMAEDLGDRQQEMPLHSALPHLDRRPFERRRAEQIRLEMQFLDIAADRDRLADHGPVVEFESRDHLERIDSRELRRLMLERGEVDLDWRDRNAFFGEENAYAARVRRELWNCRASFVPPAANLLHRLRR